MYPKRAKYPHDHTLINESSNNNNGLFYIISFGYVVYVYCVCRLLVCCCGLMVYVSGVCCSVFYVGIVGVVV
jgi:hypothetical protein